MKSSRLPKKPKNKQYQKLRTDNVELGNNSQPTEEKSNCAPVILSMPNSTQLSHPLEYTFENINSNSAVFNLAAVRNIFNSLPENDQNTLLDIAYIESRVELSRQLSNKLNDKILAGYQPPSACKNFFKVLTGASYLAAFGSAIYKTADAFMQGIKIDETIQSLGNFIVANCSDFVTHIQTGSSTITSCKLNFGQINCASYILDTCNTCNSTCANALEEISASNDNTKTLILCSSITLGITFLVGIPLYVILSDLIKPHQKSAHRLLGASAKQLDQLIDELNLQNQFYENYSAIQFSAIAMPLIQQKLQTKLNEKIAEAASLKIHGVFKTDALGMPDSPPTAESNETDEIKQTSTNSL